jgi:hypothetical protein
MGDLVRPHSTGPEAPCTLTLMFSLASKRAKGELRAYPNNLPVVDCVT